MAHPEAVKLYRAYPYVVCMDSTYKTNRYGYPLFQLIGVTPVKKSFTIAYVIMKDESIDSYTWVLEKFKMLLEEDSVPKIIVTDRELGLIGAIKKTFPHSVHLLCTWHINSVVEAKAKNIFKDGDLGNNIKNRWRKDVLGASTHATFLKGWEDFQNTWPGMVSYLNNTWMPHCEKFLKCYTNQVLHFGNTVTSRVEAAHALLKAWLGNSTLTLDTIWSRSHALLEGQHVKIRKSLEASCSEHIPTNHGRLFSDLAGHVAMDAIKMMHTEYERGVLIGARLNEMCGCAIVTTHGLLCACKLHDMHRQGQRVLKEDIHLFRRTLLYNQAGSMPESNLDRLNSLFEGVRAANPSLRRSILESILELTNISFTLEHGVPLEVNYAGYAGDFSFNWVLPTAVQDYFDHWYNPTADGHCGFRVISHALRGDENHYTLMRTTLSAELRLHPCYQNIYGNIDQDLTRINFTSQIPCGMEHWMDTLDLLGFATMYNWVICCVSSRVHEGKRKWDVSSTNLPLRGFPGSPAPYGILWILHTGNHFMRIHVRDGCPMPPINILWRPNRDEAVAEFQSIYTDRLLLWRRYFEI
ncbi:PKS-NRPS hybrid synthetase cheA [Linum perenne]